MKLQSIATLLSIAHSLSATTGVLANEESIKNVRGERKLQGGGNTACSAMISKVYGLTSLRALVTVSVRWSLVPPS